MHCCLILNAKKSPRDAGFLLNAVTLFDVSHMRESFPLFGVYVQVCKCFLSF